MDMDTSVTDGQTSEQTGPWVEQERSRKMLLEIVKNIFNDVDSNGSDILSDGLAERLSGVLSFLSRMCSTYPELLVCHKYPSNSVQEEIVKRQSQTNADFVMMLTQRMIAALCQTVLMVPHIIDQLQEVLRQLFNFLNLHNAPLFHKIIQEFCTLLKALLPHVVPIRSDEWVAVTVSDFCNVDIKCDDEQFQYNSITITTPVELYQLLDSVTVLLSGLSCDNLYLPYSCVHDIWVCGCEMLNDGVWNVKKSVLNMFASFINCGFPKQILMLEYFFEILGGLFPFYCNKTNSASVSVSAFCWCVEKVTEKLAVLNWDIYVLLWSTTSQLVISGQLFQGEELFQEMTLKLMSELLKESPQSFNLIHIDGRIGKELAQRLLSCKFADSLIKELVLVDIVNSLNNQNPERKDSAHHQPKRKRMKQSEVYSAENLSPTWKYIMEGFVALCSEVATPSGDCCEVLQLSSIIFGCAAHLKVMLNRSTCHMIEDKIISRWWNVICVKALGRTGKDHTQMQQMYQYTVNCISCLSHADNVPEPLVQEWIFFLSIPFGIKLNNLPADRKVLFSSVEIIVKGEKFDTNGKKQCISMLTTFLHQSGHLMLFENILLGKCDQQDKLLVIEHLPLFLYYSGTENIDNWIEKLSEVYLIGVDFRIAVAKSLSSLICLYGGKTYLYKSIVNNKVSIEIKCRFCTCEIGDQINETLVALVKNMVTDVSVEVREKVLLTLVPLISHVQFSETLFTSVFSQYLQVSRPNSGIYGV